VAANMARTNRVSETTSLCTGCQIQLAEGGGGTEGKHQTLPLTWEKSTLDGSTAGPNGTAFREQIGSFSAGGTYM